MNPKDHMNSSFACDLSALTDDQRQRHRELATLLRPAVVEFNELPNGYAANFRSNMDLEIAEFCSLELRCCPFFTLELSQNESTSVLTITGSGDIKPFIRAEFGIPGSEAPDA